MPLIAAVQMPVRIDAGLLVPLSYWGMCLCNLLTSLSCSKQDTHKYQSTKESKRKWQQGFGHYVRQLAFSLCPLIAKGLRKAYLKHHMHFIQQKPPSNAVDGCVIRCDAGISLRKHLSPQLPISESISCSIEPSLAPLWYIDVKVGGIDTG